MSILNWIIKHWSTTLKPTNFNIFIFLSDTLKMDMDEDEDNAPTVFEHREYQTLLLEEAKKSNVILYLPTGSGKTYIAQMLIRHFGHELAM